MDVDCTGQDRLNSQFGQDMAAAADNEEPADDLDFLENMCLMRKLNGDGQTDWTWLLPNAWAGSEIDLFSQWRDELTRHQEKLAEWHAKQQDTLIANKDKLHSAVKSTSESIRDEVWRWKVGQEELAKSNMEKVRTEALSWHTWHVKQEKKRKARFDRWAKTVMGDMESVASALTLGYIGGKDASDSDGNGDVASQFDVQASCCSNASSVGSTYQIVLVLFALLLVAVVRSDWAASTRVVVTVLLLGIGSTFVARHKSVDQPSSQPSSCAPSPEKAARPLDPDDDAVYKFASCSMPGGRMTRLNPVRPDAVETEFSITKTCGIAQPELASTDYPYSWHFCGKRRLWEFRSQIRFKVVPKELFLGFEIGDYTPMSTGSRLVYSMLKRIIFTYFGGGFYHSSGEDPATFSGEAEPPTFSIALWGFDQVIVSKAGEEPDMLGDLTGLGFVRTAGVSNFKKAVNQLVCEISTDNVYTVCFWGPSRYADLCRWELSKLPGGGKFGLTDLLGLAPVRLVVYDLENQQAGTNGKIAGERRSPEKSKVETRHLRSRKRYFLHRALWHESFCTRPAHLKMADLS